MSFYDITFSLLIYICVFLIDKLIYQLWAADGKYFTL